MTWSCPHPAWFWRLFVAAWLAWAPAGAAMVESATRAVALGVASVDAQRDDPRGVRFLATPERGAPSLHEQRDSPKDPGEKRSPDAGPPWDVALGMRPSGRVVASARFDGGSSPECWAPRATRGPPAAG